ncbi:MAG TPA: TlpA disulfide reductase family protein [Thermoanaerobaculia bacterium]|nr:TlpA disulfide reductase family protein [Thermoanaerobaculia bacterium]
MNSTRPAAPPAATPPPATSATPAIGRQAKLAIALIALCAVAALFWPRGGGGLGAAPGGFVLDSGGRPAPLGPRLAPVTLVHFWATWCPPCIQEVPALQRLTADLADRRDFTVLMVAVADSNDRVRSFLGAGSDMVLFDPNWDVAHRYGTRQLPETYLVVRGKVLDRFVGQTDWDDVNLRRKILSHLGPATARPRG